MKVFGIVFFLFLFTSFPAFAGVIYDVRTGVYNDGDPVPPIENAVVTATTVDWQGWQKIYCSEIPSGSFRGIEITTFPAYSLFPVEVGDLVTISGATAGNIGKELYVSAAEGGSIISTGSTELPWIDLTYQDIANDLPGYEWWACPIHYTEWFSVSAIHEGTNHWEATSGIGGNSAHFRFLGDFISISIGDCFQGVRGIWYWPQSFLYVSSDGLNVIDCALPVDGNSFGNVKAQFR